MSSLDRALLLGCVVAGLVFPWMVGVAVKLFFWFRGLPTVRWGYFLSLGTLPEEIWATLWFALPFVGLAWLGRAVLRGKVRWLLRDSTPGDRRVIVAAGLAGGLAGSIHVLGPEFAQFSEYTFPLAPIGAAMYVPHFATGLALGTLVAHLRARVRRRRGS